MKTIVICFFLSISSFGISQITANKMHLFAKGSAGILDSSIYQSYGLSADIFIHNKFGILYNFDLTFRNDNVRHIHAPMGTLGGPLLIGTSLASVFSSDTTDGLGGGGIILGILLLALPDGVSFHFPLGYRGDLSPYANVLGLDYIKNRTTNQTFLKYAASFGVRSTYTFNDKMVVGGFIETRKTAGMKWSMGAGATFGLVFGKRKNEDDENP